MILSGILSSIYSSPFWHEQTKGSRRMRERNEDMNKDNNAWGYKINEKMKVKQKTKQLKNTMLQSIKKTWHAKDDETWYRPRHDINTSSCYMC